MTTLEKIRAEIEQYNRKPSHYPVDMISIKNVLQIIDKYAEQEPRWIPVSERLPEPDVEVLVTDDAGGLATISIDYMYEIEETGEKEWITSQYVSAWMPLPEPYKVESEDKE